MEHPNPWFENYEKVLDLCEAESDRAAAILATAFLDEVMGEQLLNYFVDSPSAKELFKSSGPLASFSARISMAYALGFLHEESKADLHHIRKVRNHFAHFPFNASFETSPVKDFCANLSTAKGNPQDATKQQFMMAVGIAMGGFLHIMGKQKRRQAP